MQKDLNKYTTYEFKQSCRSTDNAITGKKVSKIFLCLCKYITLKSSNKMLQTNYITRQINVICNILTIISNLLELQIATAIYGKNSKDGKNLGELFRNSKFSL